MSATLLIGDTHLPFTHRDYLEFCRHTAAKHRCKRICHVGDVVDHHAISYHEKDVDGLSAGDELKSAIKALKAWQRAFPVVDVAIGNHDALPTRKAYTNGLPAAYLRSLRDVLELPKTWRFDYEFKYGHWRMTHGTGSSGHDAAFKVSMAQRMSTAQGHIHTAAFAKYHASPRDILWAMQVGCGIDHKAYSFEYGKAFINKPILGCGVVLEDGRVPLFEPMFL